MFHYLKIVLSKYYIISMLYHANVLSFRRSSIRALYHSNILLCRCCCNALIKCFTIWKFHYSNIVPFKCFTVLAFQYLNISLFEHLRPWSYKKWREVNSAAQLLYELFPINLWVRFIFYSFVITCLTALSARRSLYDQGLTVQTFRYSNI